MKVHSEEHHYSPESLSVPSRWFNSWWMARPSLHPVGLFCHVISELILFNALSAYGLLSSFELQGLRSPIVILVLKGPQTIPEQGVCFWDRHLVMVCRREQWSVISLVIDFSWVKKQYCAKLPLYMTWDWLLLGYDNSEIKRRRDKAV